MGMFSSKSDKVVSLIEKAVSLQEEFGFAAPASEEQKGHLKEVNDKVWSLIGEMSDKELAKLKEKLDKKKEHYTEKSESPMSKDGIREVFYGQWSKNVSNIIETRREALGISDDDLREQLSGNYGQKVEDAEKVKADASLPKKKNSTDSDISL